MVAPAKVVISGIGGYFPKSRNVEELQTHLMNHDRLIETARWKEGQRNVCDMTGNAEQISKFDASFFGIHRKQALFMDPMSRMCLESTFEALIDAGVNPTSLRGKNVGVFVASSISENDSMMFENVANGFGVAGQARAMLANRVSYWLNITGPSYSCDSSWTNGLAVLKHGFEAIRNGICDSVIIGATNLTMNVSPHYLFTQLGLVSPDGQTKSFSENADGYARSDTVCTLYLQRADDARRHYAEVLNVDVLFNGFQNGSMYSPDPLTSRRFVTDFYRHAGVDPRSVEYVEAYGSGIKPQDEFELNLLDDVYCKDRPVGQPLLVGSVKSNVGHTESAASFVSIVKTIIAMETGVIPANLDCDTENKNISALRDKRIKIVKENTTLNSDLIAISGFGLMCSIGHALLKAPCKTVTTNEQQKLLPQLYVLSSRTEDTIKEVIDQVKARPEFNFEYMRMVNDIFSTNITGHFYHGYVIRDGETNIEEYSHFSGMDRPVWFVYSGMGSQWCTMGRALLQIPIFGATVGRCHDTLKPLGVDLLDILTTDDKTIFDNILNSFVGIAAIQIGLTEVLQTLGITPDYILGHSVGELGCAYADGCLTAEQMILAAYYRGRASLEVSLEPGLMAAVGMGASEMRSKCPPNVDIACHNGPGSCTLSGPRDTMRDLVAKLQQSGMFARLVDVSGIAYHSRYIKPAAPLLLNYMQNVIPEPKERSKRWLSTSVQEKYWSEDRAKYASAEYFTNNLLSSVYFEEMLVHVPKDAILIEVAPHGLLQAILKRSVHTRCVNVPLTKRGEKNGVVYLLGAIGKLFIAGIPTQISRLYDPNSDPSVIRPCARGTPSTGSLVHWSHVESWRTGVEDFKDNSNNELTYQLNKIGDIYRDLQGHHIRSISGNDHFDENATVVPLFSYLPLICNIVSITRRLDGAIFEDITAARHRVITSATDVYIPLVRIMVPRGTGNFEVSDRYGVLVNGKITNLSDRPESTPAADITPQHLGTLKHTLTSDEIYKELFTKGYELNGTYRAIKEINMYENGMNAIIEFKTNWATFVASLLQLPILHSVTLSLRPMAVVFIRSLIVTFGTGTDQQQPTSGTLFNVTYNYNTDLITSDIVTIHGVKLQEYPIEKSGLVGDFSKFHTVNPQTMTVTDPEVNPIHVINIKATDLNCIDLHTRNHEWGNNLQNMLSNDDEKRIYLLSRSLPANGVDIFLLNLHSLHNSHRLRLIFVLDPSAPDYSPSNDQFYRSIFAQLTDHLVAVYKNGAWKLRKTNALRIENGKSFYDTEFLLKDQQIKRNFSDVSVRCIGVNALSSITPKESKIMWQNQLGIIDYSGVEHSTNRLVMGVAVHSDDMQTFTPDPILRWNFPEKWSFIDGATVPFAYAIAYYALYELAHIAPGESILIHNGCSSLGQALIRIAYHRGCIVYTTVSNDNQRAILLHHMRMLTTARIFDYTNATFEKSLMSITQGDGVNVVVNCLPGERLVASVRCIATLGRCILIQDESDTTQDFTASIGLSTFFKCTGMHGLRPSKLCQLSADVKRRLHALVLQGLQNSDVFPLRRTVFENQSIENILRYVSGTQVTGTAIIPIKDTTSQIKKDIVNTDDTTYIIYGENNPENLITTAYYLATLPHTSRLQIITSRDHKFLQKCLTSLNRVVPKIKIEIFDKSATLAQNLVKPTKAIIILPNANDTNITNQLTSIATLQKGLPTTRFVFAANTAIINILALSSHVKTPENVSVLRWEKKCRYADIVKFLSAAIAEEVELFIRPESFNKSSAEDFDSIFNYKAFFSILQTSVPSMSYWNPPDSTSIEMVATACPRVARECPPVFLVPGLFGAQCQYLKATLQKLMSPVYLIDTSYENEKIENVAAQIAKEIRSIYPSGPYNIIGVSSGGPLSIEISKSLETTPNTTVQLFLIDGMPATLQHLINQASATTSDNRTGYEIVLLQHMFPDNQVVYNGNNWRERLQATLKENRIDGSEAQRATQVLNELRARLNTVLNYKPNKIVFNGTTRLIRPQVSTKDFSDTLSNVCKQVKYENIKGDHFSMMQIYSLAEYINDNIMIPPINV